MLLRIFPLLLILVILPLWGIDRCYLRNYFPRWGRALFALPNVILLAALAFMAFGESYSASADYWKGIFIGSTLCLVVPETAMALCMLPSGFLRARHRRLSLSFIYLGWTLGISLAATMIYGFTCGYRQVQVKAFTYSHPDLPAAFDGYRIVQLSDLHLGTLTDREEVVADIVEQVNRCNADLVVFTGDLVNYHADEIAPFRKILRNIRARDGVLSVMGNHDYAQYFRWASPEDSLADIARLKREQHDMGWRLLLNSYHILHRATDSIAIIGVENDGKPPFPALADLPRAMRGLQPHTFKVLLSHDPTHWRREVLPTTDIPLTLSGHTHGMQLQIGSFSPASWFYDEWGGAYYQNGRALYVSLGTGEVMIPFRLGAWPEVTLITLRRTATSHNPQQ